MALIDPDATVLLHPYSRGLNVYLAQLWNRAENASDTDQQTAITAAIQAAVDARDTPATIQKAAFAADPTGHLGRHLKWMLSETVYRSLSDADISTDLDTIASGAGVGGGAFTHSLTVASLGSGLYGYTDGVGGALDPTTNPHNSDTVLRFRGDASNYFYITTLTGGYGGTSLWVVIEGFNDDASALRLFGDTGQWVNGAFAGLQAYLITQVGNTIGVNVTTTDPAP